MFGFRSKRQNQRSQQAKMATVAEVAEPRTMLAGNVVASLNGGLLKLSGDDLNNRLTISIDVDGSVSFDSANTTVNGQAAADVELDGIVDSIAAMFKGGNDFITIEGGETPNLIPELPGDLTVRMGDGWDNLAIRGLSIGGRVYAAGERHPDHISLEGADVAGDVILAGNHSRDTLAIRWSNVDGNVSLRGGGGRDEMVQGGYLDVTGNFRFQGGGQNTEVVQDGETNFDSYFEQTGDVIGQDLLIGWAINGSSGSLLHGTEFASDFPAIDMSEFSVTSSGLFYRILDPGTGDRVTTNDEVTVDYEGFLTNGTRFDSSYARGEEITFRLTNVILGWQDGLRQLAPGGKIQLVIPSQLGYGSGGGGSIPGYATLVFNIELHSIA